MPEEMMIDAIGMRLAKIPAGSGVLGSLISEQDRDSDESPQVKVTMSSFWCGICPVTCEQYSRVMGTHPGADSTLPMTMVSYAEALGFAARLSELTGDVYALPTEAQWEYACRAGSDGPYCFADNAGRLQDYAWFADNSEDRVHPVGGKLSNAWGLFDMHGNVWEWCLDLWHADGHDPSATNDPVGTRGFTRNIRGGCYYSAAQAVRSAKRFGYNATNRFESVGFRVIRKA
jgi:formylglycine-generating enzyme required for sulfatase activity